jgi:predicted RNase H-like HicB family nuclease
MMPKYFPVVVEEESNGTFSAWVPGVPGVYAAADTVKKAKQGIRGALRAHLEVLQKLGRALDAIKTAEISMLTLTSHNNLQYANLASTLLGRRTSPAKARAARMNGLKGGRPAAAVRRSSR